MVYIILVNYNGWENTIECLESVFRLEYNKFKVIVLDNASKDKSIERLLEWVEGKSIFDLKVNKTLEHHVLPSVEKPLSYVFYNRNEIECNEKFLDEYAKIIFIKSEKNAGFAGGNNLAVHYLKKKMNYDYIWFLNNDTVVDKKALSFLVERFVEKPSTGMCGSTLLFYDQPNKVQSLGGSKFNKWLARTSHIRHAEDFDVDIIIEKQNIIENKMDFVSGASMMVSRKFVEDIGPMNEEYFLYYEEIDWAIRAQSQYSLAYAPRSLVFHKDSASIGWSNKSMLGTYYLKRNGIVFIAKYYPYLLPFHYLRLVFSIPYIMLKGRTNEARIVSRLLLDFVKNGITPSDGTTVDRLFH